MTNPKLSVWVKYKNTNLFRYDWRISLGAPGAVQIGNGRCRAYDIRRAAQWPLQFARHRAYTGDDQIQSLDHRNERESPRHQTRHSRFFLGMGGVIDVSRHRSRGAEVSFLKACGAKPSY